MEFSLRFENRLLDRFIEGKRVAFLSVGINIFLDVYCFLY